MTTTVGEIATLKWGYTMADLDDLAGRSVSVFRRQHNSHLSRTDDHEEAWGEIVEVIYTAETRPERKDLIIAGAQGLVRAVQQRQQATGVTHKPGHEVALNFSKFWAHVNAPAPDFTERIVERMALPQVLGLLTPKEYEAVAAFAIYGNYRYSADALRTTEATVATRLKRARAKILAQWFEHETPRVRSRANNDTECVYGHARAEHSFRTADGKWKCRLCANAAQRRRRARMGNEEIDKLRTQQREQKREVRRLQAEASSAA